MRPLRWGVGVVTVWLGTAVLVGEAKPPDLPAEVTVRCEQDDAPRPSANDDAVPLSIDVWSQTAIPALLQQWLCQRILPIGQRDASTADVVRERDIQPVGFGAENTPTAIEARRLYELALRCVRMGKLDSARAKLRQAHLANPTCRYGQLAIQRLQELEAITPAEEPSEPAPPRTRVKPPSNLDEPREGENELTFAERVFRRVRATTQPLGLVPAHTY